MADDDHESFGSAFNRGWRSTWLSFGQWLGGCLPVAIILALGLILLIIIAALNSH
jgi:hypothetical protein